MHLLTHAISIRENFFSDNLKSKDVSQRDLLWIKKELWVSACHKVEMLKILLFREVRLAVYARILDGFHATAQYLLNGMTIKTDQFHSLNLSLQIEMSPSSNGRTAPEKRSKYWRYLEIKAFWESKSNL